MDIKLELGPLCDSISEQLDKYPFLDTSKMDVPHLDRLAAAITLLNINGLITESEAHRARRKLLTKVTLTALRGK